MARPDNPRFHGFLPIDKPAGMTSHDVVGRIRRLTGQRTVGHAGTLDPAATGVLPVALGVATRALPLALDHTKTYRAEITFGIETDTLDADGKVIRQSPADVSIRDIERVLDGWIGLQDQAPPMYSAIQVSGQRLYDLARAGVEVEVPVRTVEFLQFVVIEFSPPVLTLCIDCGAGTYVRSLARDLGHALGTCAYLSDLVRLRSGMFTLSDCWTLDQLSSMPLAEAWPSIAYHPDVMMCHLPAAILSGQAGELWHHGRPVGVAATSPGELVRVYSEQGDWIGIGEIDAQHVPVLRPMRVVAPVSAHGTQVTR